MLKKMTDNATRILLLLLEKGALGSSAIHAELEKNGVSVALVTVKRALAELVAEGYLVPQGAGRSTAYDITVQGRVLAPVDAHQYCAVEPDRRFGMSTYQFDLFARLPDALFSADELELLRGATEEYHQRTRDLPQTIQKKELERLIIELSWKSSKIEGNTYSLLDTEKLILENREAPGHSKDEARMILNHKDAFTFLHANAELFTGINRANLEKLHALLVKDLGVGAGFRSRPVGILGSKYRPLDNAHQIGEAVASLSRAIDTTDTPYGKALLALLGISYMQPFEDGNKRTSRLMGNALLLAHGCAPLSYRSVDENAYREAVLVFYELNSLVPFKKIFIEQYDFAAKNYAVK